jgi:hypothetical protein
LKKEKTKPVPSQDFQNVCLWYKMEFTNFSFEAVRDNLLKILEGKLSEHLPEYYAMTVGIICIYARPFTNNFPVGKLSEEIVPPEFKAVHENIMKMRQTLFAHAQASLTAGKDDYPNEVVIEHDGTIPRICVSRAAVKTVVLERMVPLVESLIEKTGYHRSKFAKKFAKTVRSLGEGEFRLNVQDPNAPLFVPLTEEEKLVRKKKRSAFDFSTNL